MKCKQATQFLEPCLDRELAKAQTAELEAHLAICPACHRQYSALLSVRDALDSYPRIHASPDFDLRVLDAVLRQAGQSQSFFDRLDLFFARPLYKLLGSTMLGLFLALLTVAAVLLPQARDGSTPAAPALTASTAGVREIRPDSEFYVAQGLLPNAAYADLMRELYPIEATPPRRRKEKRESSWDASTSELSSSPLSGSLC